MENNSDGMDSLPPEVQLVSLGMSSMSPAERALVTFGLLGSCIKSGAFKNLEDVTVEMIGKAEERGDWNKARELKKTLDGVRIILDLKIARFDEAEEYVTKKMEEMGLERKNKKGEVKKTPAPIEI